MLSLPIVSVLTKAQFLSTYSAHKRGYRTNRKPCSPVQERSYCLTQLITAATPSPACKPTRIQSARGRQRPNLALCLLKPAPAHQSCANGIDRNSACKRVTCKHTPNRNLPAQNG
ncbi:hypothetical protein HDN1F_03440 [gamma proteobacterium HdN1]|nr:hypothetical protein HDN1F_03440 [gamma proteobacterium HdN1]